MPYGTKPELTKTNSMEIPRIPAVQPSMELKSKTTPAHHCTHKPHVHIKEAPEYMQDNPYIHTGYRVNYTYTECFKSILDPTHNEFGNIWSHLIGLIVFLCIGIYYVPSIVFSEGGSLIDLLILSIYVLGCIFCMGSSTNFHALLAHSHETHNTCLTIDLSGISALVLASFIPPLHYIFACDETYRHAYVSTVIVFALIGLIGPHYDFFYTAYNGLFRVGFYVSMAIFGIIPVVHGFYLLGWDTGLDTFRYLFYMYGIYATGVFFYVLKFPECALPGRFDIFCHSHQIWHLLVLGGALMQFYCALHVFRSRHEIFSTCRANMATDLFIDLL